MNRFLFLIILFLIWINVSSAQNPYEQLQFQKYTVNQGLSQNIVEAIYQDSEGFMWFGTQDGLNRFDGRNFKTYYFKIDDSASLSNNYIKAIFEDYEGKLWIGTYGGGLNLFDKHNTFKRYQFNPNDPNSISNNVVYSIHQSDSNTLWMGTKEGINKFNISEGTFKAFSTKRNKEISLTNEVVYTICPSSEPDKLWLGTKQGLNLFNTRTAKVEWSVEQFNGKAIDVRALNLDFRGDLWVGTKGLGLLLLKRGQEELEKFELEVGDIKANYIRKIYSNLDGSLWVGTFGTGLFYINELGKAQYNYQQSNRQRSLSENRIVEIYKDAAGNNWIGTHGGGVNTFNLSVNKFKHYSSNPNKDNSLSNSAVNYIYQDSKGTIYVATDAGIDTVSKKNGNLEFDHLISNEDNELDYRGWSIFEDSRGQVWMSLWNFGLSAYNKETGEIKSYTNDPEDPYSIASNYVECIEEDSKGNLWVGLVGGGLDYFDIKTNRFKHYSSDDDGANSLSNDRVHSLTYDQQGDLWVATDFGLDRYNPEIDGFDHFRYKSNDSLSINYNIVRIVYKDSSGDIWIGTGGGGISKMIRSSDGSIYFKHYTTEDGLPNNNIAAIVEDDNNDLWITTYQGLAKFDPVSEDFRIYSTNDGLQGQEFIRRSATKLKDGRILVGGYNGLNVFDPDKIEDSHYNPSVRMVNASIFNNETDKRVYDHEISNIELRPNDYLVSFEVAVTDYSSISKNKIAYKLENFDKEWIDNSNRRHFSYTNLPPGDYLLRVKATNSDGIWSEKEMTISISVVPPFWKTLWFQVAAVLFVVLLIFLYIRWRVYNLRKTKEKLKVLVSERTKEVEITNKKLLEEKAIVNDQKDQITQQHQEIVNQNKIIQKQNDELKLSNLQLEEIVDERTKELREANRELYASNHELDTFFYRAAHDLKGPVSTILGLTYLALKEKPGVHMMEYLKKMDDTANRMSNILFNLQKINKIKHSNTEISVFSFKDVLEDALEDNIPDNTNKEQFIDYELKGIQDDTEICSDYVLLKIVFSNLFSNAIKFSQPGKKTHVKIQFKASEELKTYRVIFEDFGVGIKKEYRDKIFDMFFIATDRNPGTGLGLYSVKMAIKKLGGSIIVDPSYDESSGFLLQLPFPKEKHELSYLRS